MARHRATGAAVALAAVASLGACAAPASVRAPDGPRPITARESGAAAGAARRLAHVRAVGIGVPAGPPLIEVAGGRRVLLWERRVDGAPVEGDALRLVLSRSGALVGISRPAPAPLAGAPAPMARADATAAGAAAQRLLGTGRIEGTPVLAWVAPGRGGGDEPLELPRRLAWVVAGTLGDGTPCALHLDAATLELIGWDWAP